MVLLGDFALSPASPPTLLLRGVMSIAASTLSVIRKSVEGMETMRMNSAHRLAVWGVGPMEERGGPSQVTAEGGTGFLFLHEPQGHI